MMTRYSEEPELIRHIVIVDGNYMPVPSIAHRMTRSEILRRENVYAVSNETRRFLHRS